LFKSIAFSALWLYRTLENTMNSIGTFGRRHGLTFLGMIMQIGSASLSLL